MLRRAAQITCAARQAEGVVPRCRYEGGKVPGGMGSVSNEAIPGSQLRTLPNYPKIEPNRWSATAPCAQADVSNESELPTK